MERSKKTKSRTGCRMCKTKRLKCDEQKPACNQCVRRGRLCPGYRREYKWSTIATLTGKTRPPPEERSASFYQPVEAVVPPSRSDNASGLLARDQRDGSSGEHAWVAEVFDAFTGMSDVPNDPQQGVDGWLDSSCSGPQPDLTIPGEDISTAANEVNDEWTDWPGDSEVFAPPLEENFEVLQDLDAGFIASPAGLPCSPKDKDSDKSTVIIRRNGNTTSFPAMNPVDLPTTLIEYWFTHVCSMWCAFDSPQNWYRNLASDTWHHSEPVYYALQAMSASVLVDSLPHLKQTLPSLTVKAAQSIQRALESDGSLEGNDAQPLPADLLLAVMGMGTSICWADPRQMGFWFLDKARGLLDRYGGDGELALDAPGRQTVEYFRQALIYWEMLANVVSKDYQSILRSRRSKFKKRIRRAMSMDESRPRNTKAKPIGPDTFPRSKDDSILHPWTGISGDIQQTFGLVMGLCQNRCVARTSDTNLSADSLCDALCDIELAHDLEKELLGFDFNTEKPEVKLPSNETGDPNAPLSHLVDTAEAYRLAALLHLYLAFSDLTIKYIRGKTSISPGEDPEASTWVQLPTTMPREQALATLTLHLVDTLKRIPADSGTRCIQPILLISAAAGLRFDKSPTQSSPQTAHNSIPNPIHAHGTMINQLAFSGTQASFSSSFNRINPAGQIPMPADVDSTPPEPIQLTSLTLEVSAARRFVVNRLGALQQSLPPRPIGVALALVRAVWFNYDSADARLREMHWMNTMVNSGLVTLFG